MSTSGRFLALVLAAGALRAAPVESPFSPSGAYAFVGVSTAPQATQVCIRRRADGTSHWIAVGAAADGIKVLDCDLGHDTTVIQVGDKRMLLTLQQGENIGVAAAAAPADPSAPAKPPTPAEQAVRRREERMLVSDLLDVGTAQRRAAIAGVPAENGSSQSK